MPSDFFPKANAARQSWLRNFSAKVGVVATRLGVPAEQVTAANGHLQAIGSALEDVIARETAWHAAVATLATAVRDHFPPVRRLINFLKGNPGWTAADSQTLQTDTAADAPFDPAAYRPVLAAESFGGFTRITFQLRGADRLNLFWRRRGEATWRFLATDTNPPYDDHTPLSAPEVPEVREYQAWGVLDDAQIGQPSAIVTAAFGG